MKRTQIQLPDWLFDAAQGVAKRKEVSMAELVRQGLEYMVTVTPAAEKEAREWSLPEPHVLHSVDPFRDEDWRAKLHSRAGQNELPHGAKDNR